MEDLNLTRFLLAFAFVLGLIGLFYVVMRRTSGRTPMARKGSRNRIRLVEILPVGPRQRLLLVRRDDKEHLIYVGQEGQMVVESGITAKPEEDDDDA